MTGRHRAFDLGFLLVSVGISRIPGRLSRYYLRSIGGRFREAGLAVRLRQLPLPWIPDGAAAVACGVGLESFPDGGGAVWVHGLMTFCWEGEDEAGRRLAGVQLAELKAATQQQIADAFGIGVVTLWRWLDGYRRDGLAGLAGGRRGAEGPVQADAGADGEDQGAGHGGEIAGRDRRRDRGIDVRGARRAGPRPGPAARPRRPGRHG